MFNQAIYYFISVVEEGSFSAAAKKHYLSQSAISQQITKLESDLGFLLLDRHHYRPRLTDEGKQFYKLCQNIINLYENGTRQIHEEVMKNQTTIIIGMTGPFEKKHLPLIIKEFKKTHDISIDIRVLNFQECIYNLKNREIDIGFGLVNDFEHIQEFISYNIYKSHVCIVTPLDHPLSQQRVVSIDDIKDEPIIILSKKLGTHYYEDYMKAFELDGIVPHIIKEVDNLNEFLLAIELGEGIGLSAIEVINENDQVSTTLLKNTHHQAYYAVGFHRDNQKLIVNQFIEAVIQYFKDYKKNL